MPDWTENLTEEERALKATADCSDACTVDMRYPCEPSS